MKPIKIANPKLFRHSAQEQIIGEARRHPIGVFFVVFSSFVLGTILIMLMAITERNQDTFQESFGVESTFNMSGVLGILVAVMLVAVFVGMFLGIYVYKHNYVVLTDQKLVIVHSYGIIRRKVSQLSIGDIQDVSVNQKTVLSRIFRYGTIMIETAGEQANLQMNMISDPFDAVKAIAGEHEKNLKLHGN